MDRAPGATPNLNVLFYVNDVSLDKVSKASYQSLSGLHGPSRLSVPSAVQTRPFCGPRSDAKAVQSTNAVDNGQRTYFYKDSAPIES